MKIKEARGSALVVALVIVVAVAIGGAGFWVWHKNKHSNVAKTSSTVIQPTSQSNTLKSSTSNQSSTHSQHAVSANPCSDLLMSKGTSDGTAGTIYWHVVITNYGSSTCELSGYPKTVSVTDGTLSQTVEDQSSYPKVNVALAANGGTAHLVMGFPDPANFQTPNTECTVATKTKLNVTFTGVPPTLSMTFNERGCTGLTVTTVQPSV